MTHFVIGEHIQEKRIQAMDFNLKNIWLVQEPTGKAFISTKNPEKSNWLRYLRPAPIRKEKNLCTVYKNGLLFFVTTKKIAENQELLFWTDDQCITWNGQQSESEKIGTVML